MESLADRGAWKGRERLAWPPIDKGVICTPDLWNVTY